MSESGLSKLPICKARKEDEFPRKGQGSCVGVSILKKGSPPSIGLHLELGLLRHIHIYLKVIHLLPSPRFQRHSHFSGTHYRSIHFKAQKILKWAEWQQNVCCMCRETCGSTWTCTHSLTLSKCEHSLFCGRCVAFVLTTRI